jgi:hypothetical protein
VKSFGELPEINTVKVSPISALLGVINVCADILNTQKIVMTKVSSNFLIIVVKSIALVCCGKYKKN